MASNTYINSDHSEIWSDTQYNIQQILYRLANKSNQPFPRYDDSQSTPLYTNPEVNFVTHNLNQEGRDFYNNTTVPRAWESDGYNPQNPQELQNHQYMAADFKKLLQISTIGPLL
jgi:hypothetical protein